MINKCDICGFNYGPNDRYCGGCNVDLREPKGAETMSVNLENTQPVKKKTKVSAKKEETENENVIHWCAIRALCNSFEMTFPLFFNLVIILARGDRKIGFCHCAACNQGYRQMLANITNMTDNKKLTAQSREIVIKARSEKIEGLKFDISKFLGRLGEKEGNTPTQEKEVTPQYMNNEKIVIEIESNVLENAVFNVLKSEKGQEIIRSIPRRKNKVKRSGESSG